MNPMQQMKDPSAGIARELLPHLHLLSKNRYPVNNNPSLETIVAYLLEAPKIVREAHPVQWQIIDCPADGTLFLTWQPPDLGVNFASDGYVWADQEAPFNSDVRGYTLQMFMHKAGFRPQGEVVAGHSRRRYRLLPPQQGMNGPLPDPSLWLIHYSKSAPRDHLAVAGVNVAPPIHSVLQQRRIIMGAGALAKKEFMLHDRGNWPVINLPGGIARHTAAAQANMMGHRRGQSSLLNEPTIEEEEDVSRGDALDFMTPRDVSRMRYEQHHEWMEEVLESPYRTMQIIPPDLGLGRKGELESLTQNFFMAPTGKLSEPGEETNISLVGKLNPGKAEEFTKLANQKLASMQLELQKMKQAHQARVEQMRKITALGAAEKKLRFATSEYSQRKSIGGGTSSLETGESDPIDEIVKEVEASTGKKIDRVRTVTCVSKGGYQESQAASVPNSEQSQPQNTTSSTKANVTMPLGATAQGQIPQQPQQQHQPNQNMNQTSNDNETSPQTSNTSSMAPVTGEGQSPQPPSDQDHAQDNENADMEMGDIEDQPQIDDVLGDTNDWVMVDDTNMGDNGDTPSLDQLTKTLDDDDEVQDENLLDTGFASNDSANQTPQADEQQQQIQGSNQQQHAGQALLDTGDFDFGDVNTAGDALADYGADDDDLNLDNMDDSAFGDAFHATDDHDLS